MDNDKLDELERVARSRPIDYETTPAQAPPEAPRLSGTLRPTRYRRPFRGV